MIHGNYITIAVFTEVIIGEKNPAIKSYNEAASNLPRMKAACFDMTNFQKALFKL